MASYHRTLILFLLVSLSSCCCCFHSSESSPPKVRLSLYYESLCPYSAGFIVNHLGKIFTDGLIDIIDLELVPYGNAKLEANESITCQHGPYECILNTVEACAIVAWPDVTEHFNFIYCVEQLVVEKKYMEWESCFQKLGLNSQVVLDCSSGEHGKKLELQYAAQTGALEPPHRYVPWVVVDGKPLYDDYEMFDTAICKAYRGELPKACEDLLLEMIPMMKVNEANVCFSDGILMSSAL